jgi:hypothetical protein
MPALPQAITAKAVGTVTDPSGAVVANAKVEIRNVQTNAVRAVETDAQGNYEFNFLPIGQYTLNVEATGFQTTAVSAFSLSVDQTARVDVRMTIGQTAESVKVEAGAILMQTENATVGTVIDSQKVVELPLNGRSFVQLALLTPGVNPGTPGSITVRRLRGSVGQAVGMSANGARDTQNRFYYDGIEAMDLDSYSFSFSPSIDAIQEFKVQSSTYSAEIGGAPGGQVNLTTKSGTNTLRGTAWWFNRNDAFTALNGFQPRVAGAKPPRLNRNQYGANIGGPVLLPKIYNGKDKTFFFFNWESGRQIAGSFGGQALIPPAALRQGDFSGVGTVIYDPQTRQPFPNNRIPANRIANYARVFLDRFVPAPNTSEPGINYRGPRVAAPITQDQYVSRIDHTFSQRDSLYGSYIYNVQADDTTPTFGFDTRGNRARGQNVSLTEVHVFSPTVVNEVRGGFHRFYETEYFGTTDKARSRHRQHYRDPRRGQAAPRFRPTDVQRRVRPAHGPRHRSPRPHESALADFRQHLVPQRSAQHARRRHGRAPQLDLRRSCECPRFVWFRRHGYGRTGRGCPARQPVRRVSARPRHHGPGLR